MKRLLQLIGIRKWSGEDLISLQEEPLKTIDAFFAAYGNSIFNGCEVTQAGENVYNVTPGFVALQGKDQDNQDTFKVAPFPGLDNTALPVYLTLAYRVIEKEYVDGKVKPAAYDYYAEASSIPPADGSPCLEITTGGGRRFIDAVGITQKLDKTGNGRDVTVTFSQATDRANVQTGDKLTVALGKIARWFADLKSVAFTGKAADLTEDETHRFTTDTEKAGWSDKYTKQETDQKDAAALKAAKDYTDVLGNDVLRKTESYTRAEIDTKDTATLEAAKQYAIARVAEIIGGSPAALDTLYEIAAALGNDPNFATTIMALVNGKAPLVHTHTRAQITDFPTSMPASDVYAWAKASSKPAYTADEVGAAPSGHNHAGTYQPAGNYAPAAHNHDGTYQPAGNYAAAAHGHTADQISDTATKVMMLQTERSKLAGLEHQNLIPNLRVKTHEKSINICHDKLPAHLKNPVIVMLRLKKVNRNRKNNIAKSWRWGEIRHLPIACAMNLTQTDYYSFKLLNANGWYELQHNDNTYANIDNLVRGFIIKTKNPTNKPTYTVSFCSGKNRYAPCDKEFMRSGIFALAIRVNNPSFPVQAGGRPNASEYIYNGIPRYLYSTLAKFKLTVHFRTGNQFYYSMKLL